MKLVLITPFVTFILGMLTQLFLSDRRASESAISDHIADIVSFKSIAAEYWLSKGEDDISAELSSAAKVHVAWASVTAFEAFAPRCLPVNDLVDYQRQISFLYRTATGLEFETAGREMSPETAVEIARQCASIIHLMRMSKSRLYSPTVWGRRTFAALRPVFSRFLSSNLCRLRSLFKNNNK